MHILDLNLKNMGEKLDGSIMESKRGHTTPQEPKQDRLLKNRISKVQAQQINIIPTFNTNKYYIRNFVLKFKFNYLYKYSTL